ncbi:MAG TPA: ferritin family protein [Candidatus Marinimicrobia bacterium]|nr:ferritin family protein [Candidatus Neomarinimicrobiota bacterium]HQK10905.1 ferritin family protein [Candidatus Neomarinimicrobiota bacterium]HQO74435.1 ferritin family protein [Candidatus Neomarinimicrobiota bacterium]
MTIFNIRDVFDIAVKIEERGEKFYRETAKVISKAEVKELFEKLADEEVAHKKIFRQMAQKIGAVKLESAAREEFYDYLEAYTQNLIFSDANDETKIPAINDAKTALLYAIERELDSVLYYKEIKELIPASEHQLISGIIDEERRHVVRLSELKKNLTF